MRNKIKVAAIDYGFSNGLAIASVVKTTTTIYLHKFFLGTIYNNFQELVDILKNSNCDRVILEQLPGNAPGVEGKIFYAILAELLKLGFTKVVPEGALFTLLTISPGTWKPFMQKQNVQIYSNWNPKTQHEKDAMSMLWYVLRIENKNLEMIYV